MNSLSVRVRELNGILIKVMLKPHLDILVHVTELNYLDTGRAALVDSVRNCSSRRVDHGHQTNKPKLLEGEVNIIGRAMHTFARREYNIYSSTS